MVYYNIVDECSRTYIIDHWNWFLSLVSIKINSNKRVWFIYYGNHQLFKRRKNIIHIRCLMYGNNHAVHNFRAKWEITSRSLRVEKNKHSCFTTRHIQQKKVKNEKYTYYRCKLEFNHTLKLWRTNHIVLHIFTTRWCTRFVHQYRSTYHQYIITLIFKYAYLQYS